MHHRYEHINIPIEVIRTFVAIVENGSLSKAAAVLGLSQPAVTGQMKRLQMMIGGAVFDRAKGGAGLNARGTLVLSHARKILAANDQILSLGGATSESTPVRVGLSTMYVDRFFKNWSVDKSEQATFFCGHSLEIAKSLAEGYLDIACLLDPPDDADQLAHDWIEDFVWVRHRDFVISPGSPIPIVSWPGAPHDHPAIHALEKHGLAYRVAFSSYDYGVRLAAVAAGIGLMGMAARQVAEGPLVIAKDYYLPKLAPVNVGIRIRNGFPTNKAEKIFQLLMKLAPEAAPAAPTKVRGRNAQTGSRLQASG